MSLAPLSEVSPTPTSGEEGAERATSFRERKLSALQSEVEPSPGRPNASAESVQEDGYPEEPLETGALDIEDTADVEDEAAELDPDAELGESEEVEDIDGEEVEETVESLKAEKLRLEQTITNITKNRKQIESDFRDSITGNIEFRHQLEDTVEQVQAQGAIWLALANQQVEKFERLDWTQIPPEKLATTRAAAQKAMQNREAIAQKFQAVMEQTKGARERAKNREAELSRDILSRRIPNWDDEHYATLLKHAVEHHHFTPEEVNDITDWRVIEMIHRDWERGQAVEKVQRVQRKQKARTPRGRSGRDQPRSAEGRFRSARDTAFANPGDKGSFREMKAQALARERKQGVGR